MASVTLKGNPISTIGDLPKVGEQAPNFKLAKLDLSNASLEDYKGQRLILNIFHSIDTGTCASSVREFNKVASELDNTKVLCISKDLPFAMGRFCGAEGIENVEMLSDFRDGSFGKAYNLLFANGPVEGLLSRSIIVLDQDHNVLYSEQVQEVVEEPNYENALNALK
ncbi:MAG: thiol peroxidase [Urechidicola sp.]|nr:thiol peroxidase [Urechidicola sp.]